MCALKHPNAVVCHAIAGNAILSCPMHSTVLVCWCGLVKDIGCGAHSNAIACHAISGNAILSCQFGRPMNAAAQQALAADRFAREIIAILAASLGPPLILIYDCGG